MDNLNIITRVLTLIGYEPYMKGKPRVFKSINSFRYSSLCDDLCHMINTYDKNGSIAVCIAKGIFTDFTKDTSLTLDDFLNTDTTELKSIYDIYHSDEYNEYETKMLQFFGKIVNDNTSIGELDRSIFSSVSRTVKGIDTCKVVWYRNSGKDIGNISRFSNKIHTFDTTAEMVTTFENYPDGIYVYCVADGGINSYFGFAVLSNGNFFVKSDYFKEKYIGQTGNLRNGRLIAESKSDIFPYDIFEFEGYDYKGYASKYNLVEKEIFISKLDTEYILSLVLGMYFISGMFSNTTNASAEISYTNRLIGNPELLECKALVVKNSGSLIIKSHQDIDLKLKLSDVLHNNGGHWERDMVETERAKYFIDKYGDGFSDNEEIPVVNELALYGADKTEFIGTKKEFESQAYFLERKKLRAYVQCNMLRKFIDDGYGLNTVNWYRDWLKNNFDHIISKIISSPQLFEKKVEGVDMVYGWGGDYKYKVSRVSSYLPFNYRDTDWNIYDLADTSKKAKVSYTFRPRCADDICRLMDLKMTELPELMAWYSSDTEQARENSILSIYDPCDMLTNIYTTVDKRGSNFEELCKESGHDIIKKQELDELHDKLFRWEYKVGYDISNPFGFAICFGKNTEKKVLDKSFTSKNLDALKAGEK